MSTHNLCFRAKIRKQNVYPCTPQFNYIKIGCKRVFVTQTCFRDGNGMASCIFPPNVPRIIRLANRSIDIIMY